MQISEGKVVTFEYTVVDAQGQLIENSRDTAPMQYLHGEGRIVHGLEAALESKSAGDTFSITLEPAQAYGERDDSLIHSFTREELAGLGDLKVGMQLQAGDSSEKRILTVSKIEEGKVIMDENHPLAGQQVSFDVTITDVRNASEDELKNGQIHSVRCTDDCGTCDLNENDNHSHDCGCGCDHD